MVMEHKGAGERAVSSTRPLSLTMSDRHFLFLTFHFTYESRVISVSHSLAKRLNADYNVAKGTLKAA